MSIKTGQTKVPLIKSAESLQTAINSDSGDQTDSTLRRSKRLRGMPLPIYNTDLPATIQESFSETIPSIPASPSVEVLLDEAFSLFDNGSTLVEVTDSDKTLGKGILPVSIKSKKRKAASFSKTKNVTSALASPPIKKQKVNHSTPKTQGKAGNPKIKTAKERFLAASAKDTRPLPWGEPEVWAEV